MNNLLQTLHTLSFFYYWPHSALKSILPLRTTIHKTLFTNKKKIIMNKILVDIIYIKLECNPALDIKYCANVSQGET